MSGRRRDSIAAASVFRGEIDGEKLRGIVVPPDFLGTLPSAEGDWTTRTLADGRVVLGIRETDLAEHVVATIRQVRDGHGRVSMRRYEILRKLVDDREWVEAEMIVSTTDSAETQGRNA